MKKRIELFYIGCGFYCKSKTIMSSVYLKNKERFDWGFVQIELDKGNEILIKPANKEETKWAKNYLKCLNKKWEEKK